MFTTDHHHHRNNNARSRQSQRRIRPDSPAKRHRQQRQQSFPEKQRQRLPAHTASTSATLDDSCEDWSGREDAQQQQQQRQWLQRKLCPVTGILRDVHADYRVLSSRPPLGEGHYGVVRECESRANTGEVLAVKSVNKSRIRRLDHLRREVRLLSKMNHPNVLTMVDVYEDAESVHIVTEKCEGRELFDVVGENTRGDGCLSEERAARVMRELLEAVGYLHANGIVHRDIKPENVLFASADEEESSSVKLIDFGLSRRHKRGEGPMTNPVGTAYYMAPELLNGEYDKSCDVWSLGTVAYIMLCGYPPFNGETDPDIFDAIRRGRYDFPAPAWSDKSEEAKDFVKCLLRMDPRKRFTAREALGHPWIRNNSQRPAVVVVVDEDDDDAARPRSTETDDGNDQEQGMEDLKSRIRALRLSIHKFKKSPLQR